MFRPKVSNITGWSFIILLELFILLGCGGDAQLQNVREDSSIKWINSANLRDVRKIALVTFVGKSATNPEDTLHEPLVKDMYNAFWSKSTAITETVEIIPVDKVLKNELYKQLAVNKMPIGSVSPINGLTYLKSKEVMENPSIFDAGPLTASLGVDALAMIITEFSIYKSKPAYSYYYYLECRIKGGIITPPQELVWGSIDKPLVYSEPIVRATIFHHPILMLSIMMRDVLFLRPTQSQYAKIMKIAMESQSKLAVRVGERIVERLVDDIRTVRQQNP